MEVERAIFSGCILSAHVISRTAVHLRGVRLFPGVKYCANRPRARVTSQRRNTYVIPLRRLVRIKMRAGANWELGRLIKKASALVGARGQGKYLYSLAGNRLGRQKSPAFSGEL